MTGLWAEQPGFDSQKEQEFFLFATASRPGQGATQPPVQWVLGVLIPGVKWLGHEPDHSPPSSAMVNNA